MTSQNKFDLANLLWMFDESLCKVIRYLEDGNAEKALIRANEIHNTIGKLKCHLVGETHNAVEKRI